MTALPIVAHAQPDPPGRWRRQAARLLDVLRQERRELADREPFSAQRCRHLSDVPTLHLDDLSELPLMEGGMDVTFMQDRARLRAGDGDFVVSATPELPAYEEYCRDRLGLGDPHWLRPVAGRTPGKLPEACWEDRHVRRRLVRAIRNDELAAVHPHMGTFAVWELAELLSRSARRHVKVVAPPPAITRWANDKLAFSDLIVRLFGRGFVPRTTRTASRSWLARHVRDLAEVGETVVIKRPDSAGGGGNIVLSAHEFRGRSLGEIEQRVDPLLDRLGWQGRSELLVGCWESEVVASPSVQTWIPPVDDGAPIVEGVFEQVMEGAEGIFVGSRASRLRGRVQQEIVDRSWLVAWLFQQMGYVGRCSFDLLLVGREPGRERLEFIECNGRWGGTSLPMTLMNRLFGDWTRQPYANRELHVPGLDRLTFARLAEALGEDLFAAGSRQGRWILYNPGRLKARSGIDVVGLAPSWEEAAEAISRDFPQQLAEIVAQAADASETS